MNDAAGRGEDRGCALLAVAVCAGHRCAALRAASADPDGLGAAVRARSRAVLIEVPCVGECSRACVVATGRATTEPGRIIWVGRPRTWELAERSEQADRIRGWVATTPMHR